MPSSTPLVSGSTTAPDGVVSAKSPVVSVGAAALEGVTSARSATAKVRSTVVTTWNRRAVGRKGLLAYWAGVWKCMLRIFIRDDPPRGEVQTRQWPPCNRKANRDAHQ